MKLVTTDDPECQEASCRFREVPPSPALVYCRTFCYGPVVGVRKLVGYGL